MKNEAELTRPLRIEKISPNGVEEIITAQSREREALAKRFDLVEMTELKAKLRIVPERAGLNYLVTGELNAQVIQRCVVTLEPLPATITQTINVHFAAPEFLESGSTERAMEEDDIEPIQNGIIDLGELAAQHLGLALDPYPRKPGLPPVEVQFGSPIIAKNPFAKLKLVKDDGKES